MGQVSCCDASAGSKMNEIIVEDEQFMNLKAASPLSPKSAMDIYSSQNHQDKVQKESHIKTGEKSPSSQSYLVPQDQDSGNADLLKPCLASEESGEICGALNISRRSFMAYSDNEDAITPVKSDKEVDNFDLDADEQQIESQDRSNDAQPHEVQESQDQDNFFSAKENSSKEDEQILVQVQEWNYEANDPLIDDDSQQSPETVIEVLNEEIIDIQPLVVVTQLSAPTVETVIELPNQQEAMLSDTVQHITEQGDTVLHITEQGDTVQPSEQYEDEDSIQKASSKSESENMSEIHMARPAALETFSDSSIQISPRGEENEVLMTKEVDLGDGKYYNGQWNMQGKKHGHGKFKWPDGSHYEGEWQNDMANGWGVLVHSDGDVYTGNWKDDKADGFGNYQHTDGAHYSGQWTEDKQHGLGREVWPDGAFFEGHYNNGLKHGYGLFSWADGSRYAGGFVHNNIEGCGQYDWADGRRYIGGWHENKMHGDGDFLWPDGRQYTGAYRDDTKMGFGIFRWPDGRRYEGMWDKGKQHGRGKFVSNNGEAREGLWENGKRCYWLNN